MKQITAIGDQENNLIELLDRSNFEIKLAFNEDVLNQLNINLDPCPILTNINKLIQTCNVHQNKVELTLVLPAKEDLSSQLLKIINSKCIDSIRIWIKNKNQELLFTLFCIIHKQEPDWSLTFGTASGVLLCKAVYQIDQIKVQ